MINFYKKKNLRIKNNLIIYQLMNYITINLKEVSIDLVGFEVCYSVSLEFAVYSPGYVNVV